MRLYFNEGLKRYNNKDYVIAKYFFYETQNFFDNTEDLVKFTDLNDEYDDIIKSSKFYLQRIKANQLIEIADDYYRKSVFESKKIDFNLIYTALDKYREALKEITDINKKAIDIEYEAKCLSQIIIIQYRILNSKELDNIYNLGMQCLNLANSLMSTNIKKEKWYIDINKINKEILNKKKISEKNDEEFKEQMKKEKYEIFVEIDRKYSISTIDFIIFILKKYPYKNYTPNDNIESDFKKDPLGLLKKLTQKYHPDRYKNNTKDEREFYNIIQYISLLLNSIYANWKATIETPC